MVMQQAAVAPGQSVGFWHCADRPPSGQEVMHDGVPPTTQQLVPPVQLTPPQKPGGCARSAGMARSATLPVPPPPPVPPEPPPPPGESPPQPETVRIAANANV